EGVRSPRWRGRVDGVMACGVIRTVGTWAASVVRESPPPQADAAANRTQRAAMWIDIESAAHIAERGGSCVARVGRRGCMATQPRASYGLEAVRAAIWKSHD